MSDTVKAVADAYVRAADLDREHLTDEEVMEASDAAEAAIAAYEADPPEWLRRFVESADNLVELAKQTHNQYPGGFAGGHGSGEFAICVHPMCSGARWAAESVAAVPEYIRKAAGL